MKFDFVKMQAVGNDYIYIDMWQERNARFVQSVSHDKWGDFVRAVCDRHFGIGGDGVVLITPTDQADCGMKMYNADGTEGGMCGNAIRCVARYFCDTYTSSSNCIINSVTGNKKIVYNNNRFTVDMGEVRHFERIEVRYLGLVYAACYVDIGNPHLVIFDSQLQIQSFGTWCQTQWIDGINVHLVRQWQDALQIDVYERGSGITLGCGTGACAVALSAVRLGFLPTGEPIAVTMPGGTVTVEVEDTTLRLVGDACMVYRGTMDYDV